MKTILFIEDESLLQKTLNDVLGGCRVINALNGEIGIRLAEKESPDLIILDLVLPEMDGFEVLEALKGNAATKDIPVIVLTNLEEVKEIDRAAAMGAEDYLVKTEYRLEEIIDKIKTILGKL